MKKLKLDLTGRKFSKLTVLWTAGQSAGGATLWECLCECGNLTIVRAAHLTSNATKSCGCLRGKHRHSNSDSGYKAVYRMYKFTAKERGYEFKLTFEQAKNLFIGNCFYCDSLPAKNMKFGVNDKVGILYNGIDRVDNSKGYLINNVVTCCRVCNVAKSTMTIEEFRMWIIQIYTHFLN